MSLALIGTAASAQEESGRFAFRDSGESLGIHFVHRHFGSGEKRMRENMGAGVAIADFDGDGRQDIYFVQGSDTGRSGEPASNVLYLQLTPGRFVQASATGSDDPAYGMGAAWADYDADGDVDLYVTNVGRNTLLANRGDGAFVDVTEAAGVGDTGWGASAGFFDADDDGDLDLYVVNYLVVEREIWCGNSQTQVRSYCHPALYDGEPDKLYRNEGDGTFTDISDSAGLDRGRGGKGLGLAFADLDSNGTLDIFVANDSTANHLYLRQAPGVFRESGLLSGLALNGAGKAESSMGVAIDDLNGDLLPEVFLTHLDEETNTLYQGHSGGYFTDASDASGLGPPSLRWVGFGTVLVDFDLDGDLDVFVANGHIIDNIDLFDASRSHRQPPQLFENDGLGRFSDASDRLPPIGNLVGRAVALADLDGDAAVDLVITQNNGDALVLLGTPPSDRMRVVVRLIGEPANPSAFGARVTVTANGHNQSRLVHSSSSYLAQGSADLFFGLKEPAKSIRVEVRWPRGEIERFELKPSDLVVIAKGLGTLSE